VALKDRKKKKKSTRPMTRRVSVIQGRPWPLDKQPRTASHLAASKLDQTTLVLTVGHSTRAVKDFVALLLAHGVKQLIDVRTIPRSRHNPQFNRDRLPRPLQKAGIRYRHMAGLGGLRHARRDSINAGWKNASFRGFADYMQTLEFEEALDQLIHLAQKRRTAIMCAEAVPWRCHRSMIGDVLLVRGLRVEEITSRTRTRPHTLTAWARVKGKQLTYPANLERTTTVAQRVA
jgi:uncharacterized protein (DUF488 family)